MYLTKCKKTHVNQEKHNARAQRKQCGFTLIELSIILVILSFIAINLVITDTDVKSMGKIEITHDRMTKVHEAMLKYAQRNYHFPCPAVIFHLTTNTNFGISQGSDGDCDNDSGDITGIISTTVGDAYAGIIPVRELGLPEEYAFDGWDRRIKYVVAQNATDPSTYTDTSPIKILNNYSQSTAQISSWYAENHNYTRFDNVPYLFVSFGEDGEGAFERVPTAQSETAMVLYESSAPETNHAEAMNNKLVNVASGAGNETDNTALYVMPKDVMENFDDIVSPGLRYPTSINYPHFDPRTFNEGETQRPNSLNLQAWFNTDYTSNLFASGCSGSAPADGGTVSCWTDVTGTYDLTPTGTSPTYQASVIDSDSIAGNRASIRFNGEVLSNSLSDSSALSLSVPLVAFVVVKVDDWSEDRVIIDDASNSTEFSIKTATVGDGRFESRAGLSSDINGPAFNTTTRGNLHIISQVITEYTGRIYVDGVASSQVNITGGPSMNGLMVGGSNNFGTNPFDGDIMEVVLFEGLVSPQKRHAIERLLSAKWTNETTGGSDNLDMVAQ